MPEYVASAQQAVAARDNVLFTDTPVPCTKGFVIHREGSGIVTLRGCTNNCFARYAVMFGGDIAIPAGGSATPAGGSAASISLAIAVDGEPLPGAVATSTPGAAESFNNVSMFAYINVPKGCCTQVAVENTGTGPIDVQNANLVINRVA